MIFNKINVLIILIILELIYILFSFYYPVQQQLQFLKISPVSSTMEKTTDTSQAYDVETLFKIGTLAKSITVKAILTNEYEGMVVDLQKDTKKNVEYPIIFRLRKLMNQENTFLLTQRNLSNLQVFQNQNNEKKPISIEELKSGDYVTIYETLNLQKKWPDARESIIIIKQ